MSLLDQLVECYPDALSWAPRALRGTVGNGWSLFLTSPPLPRYILNVRDLHEWVKSVDSHNDLRLRLNLANLPGSAHPPPGKLGWANQASTLGARRVGSLSTA